MDELTKAFPNVPELWEGAADGAWRHEGKRPKRPCRGGHHLRRVPICRRNAPRQKIAGGIARNQTAASELTFVAPRGPFMRSIFQAARSAAGWLSHDNSPSAPVARAAQTARTAADEESRAALI
jgi:hypothetical protein